MYEGAETAIMVDLLVGSTILKQAKKAFGVHFHLGSFIHIFGCKMASFLLIFGKIQNYLHNI